MIDEATVDCYNESERITGLFTMNDDNLQVLFESLLLGAPAVVERVDMADEDATIVAVCSRGRHHQRIPILDLLLPDDLPNGWARIEACRRCSK